VHSRLVEEQAFTRAPAVSGVREPEAHSRGRSCHPHDRDDLRATAPSPCGEEAAAWSTTPDPPPRAWRGAISVRIASSISASEDEHGDHRGTRGAIRAAARRPQGGVRRRERLRARTGTGSRPLRRGLKPGTGPSSTPIFQARIGHELLQCGAVPAMSPPHRSAGSPVHVGHVLGDLEPTPPAPASPTGSSNGCTKVRPRSALLFTRRRRRASRARACVTIVAPVAHAPSPSRARRIGGHDDRCRARDNRRRHGPPAHGCRPTP